MRVIREIAEMVDLFVLPVLGRVLLFLLVPVALLALFGKPGCACNTKDKAYRTAMRSDLYNMVDAQNRYFAQHKRYTRELGQLKFRTSTGVVIDSIFVTATGFGARASYPTRTPEHCHVVYGPSWNEESRPSCDGDVSGHRPKR